jgi:RNA polymerase sigma-70 factor (ECF subfamily)
LAIETLVSNARRLLIHVASSSLADPRALAVAQPADLVEADNATLARALIDGVADAPRLAWNRFSPMVRRIVQRTLGPEHDCEDVVQEVFFCLFNQVHTLREPAALKAFIISITVLTTRREIRRKKLRRFVGLGHVEEVADLRVVTDDTDSREALTRFYRILDRIRTRDRTAFVLRFIEGMEVADVASAMGVSIPTVRRCFTRARQRVSFFAKRDPFLADYLTTLGNPTGGE